MEFFSFFRYQHIYLELAVLCGKSRLRPRFCIIARRCTNPCSSGNGRLVPSVKIPSTLLGCCYGHVLRIQNWPHARRHHTKARKRDIRFLPCSISTLMPSHKHAYLPLSLTPTQWTQALALSPRQSYNRVVQEHSASDHRHISPPYHSLI